MAYVKVHLQRYCAGLKIVKEFSGLWRLLIHVITAMLLQTVCSPFPLRMGHAKIEVKTK